MEPEITIFFLLKPAIQGFLVFPKFCKFCSLLQLPYLQTDSSFRYGIITQPLCKQVNSGKSVVTDFNWLFWNQLVTSTGKGDTPQGIVGIDILLAPFHPPLFEPPCAANGYQRAMSRRWWTFSSVRSIHMVDSLDPSRLAGICDRNEGPNEGSRLHWLPAPCYFTAKQLGGWGFPSRKVRDVFLGMWMWLKKGRTSQEVKGVAFYSWLHDYILQSLWNQASPCVQYLHIASPTKQKCYWYWHTTQQPAFHQLPIILAPSTTVRMVQFQYVTISPGQLATSRTLRRSSKAPEGLDKRCKIVDMDRPKGLGVVALDSIAAGQQVL